jgi:hypothetical protein
MKHHPYWLLLHLFGLLCIFSPVSSFAQHFQRPASLFRWEAVPIGNSAELLTFFFEPKDLAHNSASKDSDLPLLSVVRDTLASPDPEVHRLRYVWVHTYTVPSLRQRLAAAVPFVYNRFGNAPVSRDRVPPSVLDISTPHGRVWQHLRASVVKLLPFYPKPPLFESTFLSYSRNQTRYKDAQLSRAAAVLDLYNSSGFESPLMSFEETRELQARLSQAQKFLSQFLDPAKLEHMYLNEMKATRLACAQNWELLRQRAEAEDLYFDPLLLPDGTATHALLWISKGDLQRNHQARFDGRFLSISNPWRDRALQNWNGIIETRYFDYENRLVDATAPGARRVELIPLALYGLDHPKIPALLIDFRKPLNAKRRELSARARDVLANNLAPVSTVTKVSNAGVHFVMRRKGRDIFQPSRFRSYSQLKLLLALDVALSPQLRAEIGRRLEFIADNPLENDLKTELQLARNQYEIVLAYAGRSDGLEARLQRDRRDEIAAATHTGAAKALHKIADVTTLGIFKHRGPEQSQLHTLLQNQRRNDNHVRYLRAVIKSGSPIEVEWDVTRVRNSLRHVASRRALAENDLANLSLQVFAKAHDEETRRACLEIIHQLDRLVAERAFARLLNNRNLDDSWRTLAAQYLAFPVLAAPPNSAKSGQAAERGITN